MPFVSSIRKSYSEENRRQNHFEVTGGDVVYTAGGYKIHMFTTVGESELNISYKSNVDPSKLHFLDTQLDAEILVIGGGGSGGSRHGGGGGAGGMVTSSVSNLSEGNYSTAVGGGGASYTGDRTGNNGANSTFGTITANAGGGGGNWGPATPTVPRGGGQGGSGGGSGGREVTPGQTNQPVNQPYGAIGNGYPGGWLMRFQDAGPIRAGGGGGAGTKGFDGNNQLPRAGDGGQGRANSILGTNYFWAGGGGGGTWDGPGGGNGGRGGGGGGAGGPLGSGGAQALNNGSNSGGPYPGTSTNTRGGDAGTNTGAGGGGCNQTPSTSGAGGPGIVVVRYRI